MSVPKMIRLYVFCILCIVFSAFVLGDGGNSALHTVDVQMNEVEINEIEIDEVEINEIEIADEVTSEEVKADEVEKCKNEIMTFFDNEKKPSENFNEALKNYTIGHFEQNTNNTNDNHAKDYFMDFLRNVSEEDLEAANSPKEFCNNHYNNESNKTMCYEALTVLLKPFGNTPEQRDECLTKINGLDALTHLFDNQINNREEYLNLLKINNTQNQLGETSRMFDPTLDDTIYELKVGVMLSYFTHIQQVVANIDHFPTIEQYCIDAIEAIHHPLEYEF